MKHFFIVMCCLSLTALSVMAETDTPDKACDSGYIYTGKNHIDYCISNKSMNWWSAFQWCQAHQKRLATIDEFCNYGEETWQTRGHCPNYTKSGASDFCWTATTSTEKNKAYRVVSTMRQSVDLAGEWGKAVCVNTN